MISQRGDSQNKQNPLSGEGAEKREQNESPSEFPLRRSSRSPNDANPTKKLNFVNIERRRAGEEKENGQILSGSYRFTAKSQQWLNRHLTTQLHL